MVLVITGLIDILALIVGHSIRFLIFIISNSLFDVQLRSSDGLTRRGTDHHKTRTFVDGLGLGNGVDIGDEIQTAYCLSSGVGLELHHIHAYRKSFECQRVLEKLVRFLTLIGTLLLENDIAQEGLDLLISCLAAWRIVDIAIGTDTIHLHRERREVAELIQRHVL